MRTYPKHGDEDQDDVAKKRASLELKRLNKHDASQNDCAYKQCRPERGSKRHRRCLGSVVDGREHGKEVGRCVGERKKGHASNVLLWAHT